MGKTNQPHAKDNLCGAKTRAGTPCKNSAMANGRCRMHGGKSTGAPKKNKNSEKHGLFSKHIPKETMDLIGDIEGINTIDILWNNIKIQYAAIIRAQNIMHVKDKEEMIKELKKEKFEVVKEKGEFKQVPIEKEYEFQFSWDRQATFITAQSRAMTTLSKMIKDYEELCKTSIATEEQKQKLEQIKANTELTKERTKLIKGTKKDTSLLDALINVVNEDE